MAKKRKRSSKKKGPSKTAQRRKAKRQPRAKNGRFKKRR